MSEKGEGNIQENTQVKTNGKPVEKMHETERQNDNGPCQAELSRNVDYSLEEDEKSCNSCKKKKIK